MNSNWMRWLRIFTQFHFKFQMPLNMKLCPSTNCTTFTLGESDVFRWNLENTTKVLGWLGGSKGLSGSLTRVLTKLDEGGSLGVAGWVFEVMAQVDPCLTKVNSFDWIIRVNEFWWKPGASQPTALKRISSRDLTIRLEKFLLTRQSYKSRRHTRLHFSMRI
jgi:hypothetical protein